MIEARHSWHIPGLCSASFSPKRRRGEKESLTPPAASSSPQTDMKLKKLVSPAKFKGAWDKPTGSCCRFWAGCCCLLWIMHIFASLRVSRVSPFFWEKWWITSFALSASVREIARLCTMNVFFSAFWSSNNTDPSWIKRAIIKTLQRRKKSIYYLHSASERLALPKLVSVRWNLLRHPCWKGQQEKISGHVSYLSRSYRDLMTTKVHFQTFRQLKRAKQRIFSTSIPFWVPRLAPQSIASGSSLLAPVRCGVGLVLIIKHMERDRTKVYGSS